MKHSTACSSTQLSLRQRERWAELPRRPHLVQVGRACLAFVVQARRFAKLFFILVKQTGVLSRQQVAALSSCCTSALLLRPGPQGAHQLLSVADEHQPRHLLQATTASASALNSALLHDDSAAAEPAGTGLAPVYQYHRRQPETGRCAYWWQRSAWAAHPAFATIVDARLPCSALYLVAAGPPHRIYSTLVSLVSGR